jgi:hypothetical protein
VPHNLRGCRDKMRPALPDRLGIVNQLQVRFVENGGRLQGVASSLPAHVMVGEPVQFRMHQREQLSQRFLVSVAPLAEQLGDRLSRRSGRRHRGILAGANSNTIGGFLQHGRKLTRKNCAGRGGFQPTCSLTHMNRHKQTRRKNQNRNQTLNDKNQCNQ